MTDDPVEVPAYLLEEEAWIKAHRHVYVHVVDDRAANPRVNFFPSIAKTCGVRVSALCYCITAWTRRKRRKYGASAYEYDPAAVFGAALGVTGRQLRRIAVEARDAGLIDFQQYFQSTKFWVTDTRLYSFKEHPCHYDRDLAEEYGVNGAILLSYFRFHCGGDDPDKEEHRIGFLGLQEKFPWMNEDAVDYVLRHLKRKGLLDWDFDHVYPGSKRFFLPKNEGVQKCPTDRKNVLDGSPMERKNVLDGSAKMSVSYTQGIKAALRTKRENTKEQDRSRPSEPRFARPEVGSRNAPSGLVSETQTQEEAEAAEAVQVDYPEGPSLRGTRIVP